MPALTVAVVSDLHFFVRDEKATTAHSHLPVDAATGAIASSARGKHHNPFDDLIQVIAEKGLRADVLLCPGDITTRANPDALRVGWQHLVELARALNADLLCAATGNHDVESRSQEKKLEENLVRGLSQICGPVEKLKLLDPLYPVCRLSQAGPPGEPRVVQGRYFGESFVFHDADPRYRVLVFNSCADHGHDDFEYERGTVPDSALRWIKQDIAALNTTKINLLLAHHPLAPQSGMDGDKYSFAAGGDQLLRAMEEVGDDWLVIHGHKHHGELRNGQSSTNVGMTIFSAASFSAVIPSQPQGAENQFYVLELDRDEGRLCGTVRAWNWNLGHGWQHAPPGDTAGVFDGCGFGCTLAPNQLALAIQAEFAKGVVRWADIIAQVPALTRTLPDGWRATRTRLRQDHSLEVEADDLGYWTAVTKGVS
jgi:3',5'-cyclic AMP phosphodiesterase CpdA